MGNLIVIIVVALILFLACFVAWLITKNELILFASGLFYIGIYLTSISHELITIRKYICEE